MINKNDCFSLLMKLEDSGIDVNQYIKQLAVSKEVPIEVLKFISMHQGIEAGNFYELLRRNHNNKKSPLYKNILKEQKSIEETVTILSCLLTQIVLYGNKLESSIVFFKEVRAEEIARVLNSYFKTGIADDCISLLKLIKTDLLVLEYIAGRRELQ